MGANFKFDEMLPTVGFEAKGVNDPQRQVEVFTHGGCLYLRIGAVGAENMGTGRSTVELSKSSACKLIDAIKSGVEYLNLPQ